MINRWSNFSTDGTYRGEDGNTYTMYHLICLAEAKESVLERLSRLQNVTIEDPYAFVDGTVGIDYCKQKEGESEQ